MPPEVRNIGSAFVIRNYYTIVQDGKPSDDVEKNFYGKIDNYIGDVFPQIIDLVRQNRAPNITGNTLEGVRSTIFELTKRTPVFTKEHDDVEIGREIVEGTLAEIEGKPKYDAERAVLVGELKNVSKLKQHGRDIRVRSVLQPSEKIDAAMKDFRLRFAVSRGKHSFILTSLVVYRIGNGGVNGFANPDFEMWLPIAPDIALILLRDPEDRFPLVYELDRDKVREINEFAVRQSDQIVSHSRALLESLIA